MADPKNDKATSRRNFAKSVAATVAAIPVASSLVSAKGQRRQAQSFRRADQRTHDTPPPILITDGSLKIESDEGFAESHPNRYLYRGRPDVNSTVAHIRVFQDNGDLVYQDLEAHGSSIELIMKNEGGNEVGKVIIKQEHDSGHDYFQIDSDKQLAHNPMGGGKRPHKYDHPGGGGGFRLDSIEITNPRGAKTKYTAPPTGTGAYFLPSDYRVMIWRIPD